MNPAAQSTLPALSACAALRSRLSKSPELRAARTSLSMQMRCDTLISSEGSGFALDGILEESARARSSKVHRRLPTSALLWHQQKAARKELRRPGRRHGVHSACDLLLLRRSRHDLSQCRCMAARREHSEQRPGFGVGALRQVARRTAAGGCSGAGRGRPGRPVAGRGPRAAWGALRHEGLRRAAVLGGCLQRSRMPIKTETTRTDEETDDAAAASSEKTQLSPN